MQFESYAPTTVFEANKADDAALDVLVQGNALTLEQADVLRAIKRHFANPNFKDPNRTGKLFRALSCISETSDGTPEVCVLLCYYLGAKNVLVITPHKNTCDQFHADFCGSIDVQTKKVNNNDALVIRRGIFKPESAPQVLPSFYGTKATSRIDIPKIFPRDFRQTLLVLHAQTFSEHTDYVILEELPRDYFDLVIVAQANLYPAPTKSHMIDHFNCAKIVFMTTTTANLCDHTSMLMW